MKFNGKSWVYYRRRCKHFAIVSYSHLESFLQSERENWMPWLVIAFACGIYAGLSLPFKTTGWSNVLIIIASSMALLAIYRYKQYCPLCVFLMLSSILAYALGSQRSHSFVKHMASPQLSYSIASANIDATLEEILFSDAKTKHLLLRVHRIKILSCKQVSQCIEGKTLSQSETPIRVRLTVNKQQLPLLHSGDSLRLRASLHSNPPQLLPRAYNFAEIAYFRQIGAVGSLQGTIIVNDPQNQYLPWWRRRLFSLENLRLAIKQRLEAKMQQPAAGVAAALLVGYPGAIMQQHADTMRTTGLAHLIAISGLHMATVVGLVFLLCRHLCAFSTQLGGRYDSKKISAVVAMLVGLMYLAISGSAVSAQRAYLMTVIMLISVLSGRRIISLYSVALTVVILLCYNPYMIKTPSFQMSFAAAISLITVFNIGSQYLDKHPQQLWRKVLDYLLGIFIGSVATELIINPIAIYHFFLYSPYGDIVNFIAMPLTTFIVIPCGFIGMLLMPLGLEWLPLKIMEYGIDIILYSAALTLEVGQSVFTIAKFPAQLMRIMTLSVLWLAVIKHRIRFIGAIVFIMALILALCYPKPDLLVFPQQQYFVAKIQHGYCSSRAIRSDYQYQLISKYLGVKVLSSCPRKLSYTDRNKQVYQILTLRYPSQLRKFCSQIVLEPTVVVNFTSSPQCLDNMANVELIQANTLAQTTIFNIQNGKLSIRE